MNAASQQKIWGIRIVGVVFIIGILAISAPLVWAAVSAGAGIATLVAMGVAGFTVFRAIPMAMQVLENRILKQRKAEARRNPIEQLQNEMLRRAGRLKSFRRALITVDAQIESIAEMLEERRHTDPSHILQRQERGLQRLQQFHTINLNRLKQAHAALEEFRSMVERKESEWRIALAIGDANELMDPHAADNLMQDLLTDTALRSVQKRFNSVFAELDVQMSSMDAPTRELLDRDDLNRIEALDLSVDPTRKTK